MARRDITVRVRPQRIAVLVPAKASWKRLRVAFSFLSMLWGGRYCPVIPVDSREIGKRAAKRLSMSRPDIICGLNVDHERWQQLAVEFSHSRSYFPLTESWRQDINLSMLGLISAHAAFDRIVQDNPGMKSSRGRFVSRRASKSLQPLYDVAFGIHTSEDENILREKLKAEPIPLDGPSDFAQFALTCAYIGNHWSWLDLSSASLDQTVGHGSGFVSPPTIVIVASSAVDLPFYWCLRAQHGVGASGRFLPIPAVEIESEQSVRAVIEWIKASGIKSNYCVVTSETAPQELCVRLAGKLRRRLRGSEYEHVDIETADALWPVVIATEKQIAVPAEIDDQMLTLDCPSPNVTVRRRDLCWMVDLAADASSKRAVGELNLPKRRAFMDVLQASTPPDITLDRIARVGYGFDSISIRCDPRGTRIRYQLPSAQELLEEHLRECGFKLTTDEKRSRYEAAIELCGGLVQTAQVVSGTARLVLDALRREPQAEHQIISRVQRTAPKQGRSQSVRLKEFIRNQALPAQRVTMRRFESYDETYLHSEDGVRQILTKWSKRRIIERRWRLDSCQLCLDHSWIPHIDIRQPVMCPGCGAERTLPKTLQVGFALNPLIANSIDEGLAPVALTGRFLKNLTHRGFLWIPGVKGTETRQQFDLDIVALCDGTLVIAECKRLTDTDRAAKTWPKVKEQFKRTIQLGNACAAEMAIFACLSDDIPRTFVAGLQRFAGPAMRVLVLRRRDLEEGHLYEEKHPGARLPVHIAELRPASAAESRARRKRRGVRQISF